MEDLVIEFIESLLLFAFISAASLWIANSLGFFKKPAYHTPFSPRVTLPQVVGIFLIYLGTLILLGGSVAKLLHLSFQSILSTDTLSSPFYLPLLSSFVQLITTVLAGFFIFVFCKLQKDRASMLLLWKDPHSGSIIKDIGAGALTWVISFPVVMFVGELFDFFLLLVFGPQEYEQVAVRYLKMSLGSSVLFVIALFTVVIAAPILEELLFRGFLLNYLKRFLGSMGAILVSSIAFALFHFSLSQDLGNISLVASLFTLALFLGYIYERQRSLFASITLHMSFNIVSVLRISLSP